MTNAATYNLQQYASGKLTMDAITELVRDHQRSHGLTVDGLAGPKTIASIEAVMSDLPLEHQFPALRCWPLAKLHDGRKPRITSRHWTKNPSRAEPDRRHNGVDLLYEYVAGDPPTPIGDSGRTKGFWIPAQTPALAAAAGVVEIAGPSKTGQRVWIRHETGHRTGYFHLSERFVTNGDTVTLGEVIGIIGDNPSADDPDHLHFELYFGDLKHYPSGGLDPEPWFVNASWL